MPSSTNNPQQQRSSTPKLQPTKRSSSIIQKNNNKKSSTSPSGFNYHLHQRAASSERNNNGNNHHNRNNNSPPPATHNFRISLGRLLGMNQSPTRATTKTSSSNNNGGTDDVSNNNNDDDERIDDEASRVIEALFPDASFTIPSPKMMLQMERDRLDREEEQRIEKEENALNKGRRNSNSTPPLSRRLSGSFNNSGNNNSGDKKNSPPPSGSTTTNDASRTPAVRRRSSVGSLIMSQTEDLVPVTRPKFRRGSDGAMSLMSGGTGEGGDDYSASGRRRRKSSHGTSSVSPRKRPSSASAFSSGYGKQDDGNNNNSTSRQSKQLSITEESSRWGAEDLEVLRLLLRTVKTASGASSTKRLLPSTGVAARVLLSGTSVQQLDAPVNTIRTRFTLGNLRTILSSQSSFDHVKINSPRSVTVVLRNGLQCDELVERVSDMVNDRVPSEMLKLETKQLMAKLEYEYRSLCDTISRRDAVEFLRAPTVPDEACQPTQSEVNTNYVEATKRRGLMKLSRHQRETERLWNEEQNRMQREREIEDRLRRRNEELESRKQRARIQHSMNELERNKPIVSYKKKINGNDDKNSDDSSDGFDSDDSSGDSADNNSRNHRKRPFETEATRRARKEEKRRRRLVNTRQTSPYGKKRSSSSSSTKNLTTSERVAKVRATRQGMEREKLIRAHQVEAMRMEQVRDCEDRKMQRFQDISHDRAAHNAHVRNAVNATKRTYEFEKIRRLAEIENEEARMMIRKEQQQRMKERLREQLRVAQHLDLEAENVIKQGTVTLGQSLSRLRAVAEQQQQQEYDAEHHHHHHNQRHQQVNLTGRFALEETQHAMMKIANSEAKLERQWQQML